MSEPRMATNAWWDPQILGRRQGRLRERSERLRGAGPRSFNEWIHQTIEHHAGRGPTGRADLQIPDRPVTSERDGLRRAHLLRVSSARACEQVRAETENLEMGRKLSVSGWIYEVVAVATRADNSGHRETRRCPKGL